MKWAAEGGGFKVKMGPIYYVAVSYTHLTLPTMLYV